MIESFSAAWFFDKALRSFKTRRWNNAHKLSYFNAKQCFIIETLPVLTNCWEGRERERQKRFFNRHGLTWSVQPLRLGTENSKANQLHRLSNETKVFITIEVTYEVWILLLGCFGLVLLVLFVFFFLENAVTVLRCTQTHIIEVQLNFQQNYAG